jgi:CheY-like chemotaxis protein
VKVQVVEDSEKMASFCQRALEDGGYSVDIAATGADGVWNASHGAWKYPRPKLLGASELFLVNPPPLASWMHHTHQAIGLELRLFLTVRELVGDPLSSDVELPDTHQLDPNDEDIPGARLQIEPVGGLREHDAASILDVGQGRRKRHVVSRAGSRY